MGAIWTDLEGLAKELNLSKKVVGRLVEEGHLGRFIGDKIRVRAEEIQQVRDAFPKHNWDDSSFAKCPFAGKKWFDPHSLSNSEEYIQGMWPGIWCDRQGSWCDAPLLNYKECGSYQRFEEE